MKKRSYLSERRYKISNDKSTDCEKVQYWKSMLGDELLKKIISKNRNVKNYLQDNEFVIRDTPKVETNIILENGYDVNISDCIYFLGFYTKILQVALQEFKKFLGEKSKICSLELLDDLKNCLVERIQKICIRTLIYKMNVCKQKGELIGINSKEEYDFFCTEMLGDEAFINALFLEFPILERCIQEKIDDTSLFYKEVIDHFETDKNHVANMLAIAQEEYKIKNISCGIGDSHNFGRQVVKVKLTNGSEIIYKPHSMANEELYYKLLKKISDNLRIEQYEYPIVSFNDHSWCKIIETKQCFSEEELKMYYQRIGIQLFVVYLLGIRDLHSENIIAAGEYPVIVDLEMLFNMKRGNHSDTTEDMVRKSVFDSVLISGLLPFYKWNYNGEGVNVSALSGKAGQVYPFKIPRITDGYTSEMRITYENPLSGEGHNLAKMNDGFIDPSNYEDEIIVGFKQAYEWVLSNKDEILNDIKLGNVKNRVLLADTQKYAMLLSASYHPSLLMDGAERELFLHSLWAERSDGDKKIVEEEIRSLLRGDIPYFYVQPNSSAIWSNKTIVQDNYYEKTVIDILKERFSKINKMDLHKQIDHIQISLEMSEEKKTKCFNSTYSINEVREQKGTKITEPCEQLIERLLDNAIWNDAHTEVGWEIISFTSNKQSTWDVKPMGKYFYNGQAGMLVLFYGLYRLTQRKDVLDIYSALRKSIFEYTEKCVNDIKNLQTKCTGMYDGEASILYTYLLLFNWSKENIYLERAEKHAEIVMSLLEEDTKFDLMYGNAGAAKALVNLYCVTNKKQYLNAAEHAINILLRHKTETGDGIAWKIVDDIEPMSGMAHGNCGILSAIILLWKATGENKYKKIADQIIAYENTMYNTEIENWQDARIDSGEICGSVAWCHGAAGILLSRARYYLECKDILSEEDKKVIEDDIKKAYRKVSNYYLRDSYSLCHGICGNIWILEYIKNMLGRKEEINISVEAIKKKMEQEVYLLPQEMINPGLMNGYGGILYYLIKDEETPFILG